MKSFEPIIKQTNQTYFTHDNGSRPYKVIINDNNIHIHKDENDIYSKEPIMTIKNFTKVFIGKSPKNEMTEFSDGYSDWVDGNSILVNTKNNEYICIFNSIFSFTSLSPIINYYHQ